MNDPKTIERILLLHPKVRTEVAAIYDDICKRLSGRAICRFAYTLRSFDEQAALYAQGRTKPGKIVTNAGPGQSYHNYGLAVDIVLLKDTDGNGSFETASWETNVDFDGDGKADWMEVVAAFTSKGWEWGGSWPKPKTDMPHFEKSLGFHHSDLLRRYEKRMFIEGTKYVLI